MSNDKTHASLFSGIGGFDLAAQWAGFENLFHCEKTEFCRQVLNYHFPESISYEDITKTDFREWRGKITVLSGGFPCQPFSVSGQRKGTEDDRYLWPEMLRAIDEIRPDCVIGENVAGLISMVQSACKIGMENQTSLFEDNKESVDIIESEYIIESICKDLEQIGYSIQPIIIPACAVGAPHRRDRIWFVANCTDSRVESEQEWLSSISKPYVATNSECSRWREIYDKNKSKESSRNGTASISGQRIVADTKSQQGKWSKSKQSQSGAKEQRKSGRSISGQHCEDKSDWSNFPTEPPIYPRNDGFSYRLAGRPISEAKWREEAVKACGNAIVPQVAYELFNNIKIIVSA